MNPHTHRLTPRARWPWLLLLTSTALAGPGEVDPGFTGPGTVDAVIYATAVDSGDQVLVGGDFTKLGAATRNRIARLDLTGAVDPTFDPAAGPNSTVYSVAFETGGKVLAAGAFTQVAGQPRTRVVRFNANGSLDAGFNPGEGPNNVVYRLLPQSDGSVVIGGAFTVVAGQPRGYLARLQASGTLDLSFAPAFNGAVITVIRLADGKLLAGGDFTVVSGQPRNRIVRLNADGSLDTTFDPGSGANSTVRSLNPLPDGRVLIGGNFTDLNGLNRNYLGRLQPDGLPDVSFTPASPNNIVYTTGLLADGRIFLGGEFTDVGGQPSARLARLRPDGTVDPTFKPGTGADAFVFSVAGTSDDNLIVAGNFSKIGAANASRVAKVELVNTAAGGEVEFTAGSYQAAESQPSATIQVRRTGSASAAISVQFTTSNGTANVADYTPQTGVLNFAAGESTKTFTVPLKTDTFIEDAETVGLTLSSPTGGAVLGSRPTAVLIITEASQAITAGSRDPDYSTSVNGPVYVTTVQGDGQLLIGGEFHAVNGSSRQRLARLNVDGTLDDTFRPATWFNSTVSAIALQTDGHILVGGSFTIVNGATKNRIVRLTSSGEIDPQFFPGTGPAGAIYTLLELPDKSILAGGTFGTFNNEARGYLVRLLSDGNVDTTFNAQLNSTVFSLVRAPDGKILVSGDFTVASGRVRNRILRLNADGTLDTTFDPGFGANSTVRSLALQPDGQILLGGSFTEFNGLPRADVCRLNPTGLADLNFTPSAVDNVVYSVAVQPDGRVLIGGEFTNVGGQPGGRLARLRSDGSRDTSFNVTQGANAFVYSVRWLDGTILAAGNFTQYEGQGRDRFVQVRPTPAVPGGEIEFSTGQYSVSEAQSSLTIQIRRNGSTSTAASVNLASANVTANIGDYTPVKELVSFAVGEASKNVVIALKPDNNFELDETFSLTLSTPSSGALLGTYPTATVTILSDDLPTGIGSRDTTYGGSANGVVYATLLQPDGKLLVGGEFSAVSGVSRLRLARLNPDGSPDPSFNPATSANATIFALALQSDGKVVIGGSFTLVNGATANRVARLNADGTFDPTFSVGTGAAGIVYSLLNLPDDSVLVGGSFGTFNNEPRAYLAYLLSDGSLETGFNAQVNSTVLALAATPTGQIVAGGDFTSFGGQPRNRVAQFGPGGDLDPSFNPLAGPNSTVRSIAVQTDGQILIGGSFGQVNSANIAHIARLTTAGVPDSTFGPVVPNNILHNVSLAPDGKIFLGGDFTQIGGQNLARIARLLPNGTVDSTFNVGTGFDSTVFTTRSQSDGQVVVGGAFSSFNGFPAPRLTRLVGAINQRFRFTTVETVGTTIRLTGQGAAGQRYALEGSANLSNWTPLVTNPPAATSTIQFIDATPPPALRYYRAVTR